MKANPVSLSDVLDALDIPVIVLDRSRRILLASQPFVREWAADDCAPGDLEGHALDELDGPLDETLIDHLGRLPLDRAAVLAGVSMWRPEDDRRRTADITSRPAGEGRIAVRVEQSADESRLRGEVRRVQRLAVLGSLAAGVAHDLNNQLAATLNIAHLLRQDLGADSPHERALDIIEGSSREAVELSRRLLLLAGRGEPEIRRVELRELLERAMMLVRHELPPADRFRHELGPGLGEMDTDPTQLQYAFVLLALVGARALREGGEGLLRATRRRGSQRDELFLDVVCDRPADASEAIDELTRIALENGGEILDESTAGEVRLSLRLPIAEPEQTAALEAGPGGGPAHAGPRERPTVLVVDDDPMVRDVARAMIHRIGYQPVTADGGRDAIALLDQGLVADIVIVDLLMSDLDGATTLSEVRARQPAARIVVSSGMGAATRVDAASLRVDGVLEKPYTLATLKKCLDDLAGSDTGP